MKELTEYSSSTAFVQALVAEGLVPRTQKLLEAYPDVKAMPKANWVRELKQDIFREIQSSNVMNAGPISGWRLTRLVRGDNHKDEFKIALHELIEDRKITKQRLETGKRGRPCFLYHLFEN
jgi:hypothetical protein